MPAVVTDAAHPAPPAELPAFASPVRPDALPAVDAEAIRAGLADLDGGRVTDGETVFAELRQLTGRG